MKTLEAVRDEISDLQNLSCYSWFRKGAIQMLLALERENSFKDVYSKALFKELTTNPIALDRFLEHDYDTILYKNHKTKGKKVVGVEACLGERTSIIQPI